MDPFARRRPLMRRQRLIVESPVGENEHPLDSQDKKPSVSCTPEEETYLVPRLKPGEILKHFEKLQSIFGVLDFNVKLSGLKIIQKSQNANKQAFTHCPHAVTISQQHARLLELYQQRTQLQFYREVTIWMGQIYHFLKELQKMVRDERNLLDMCVQNVPISERTESKLEFLVSICDDLRSHIGRWINIRNRIRLDSTFLFKRYHLFEKLRNLKKHLFYLSQCAIFWVAQLIQIGLKVFACSSSSQIASHTLWNITRGTEEFELIVKNAKCDSTFMLYLSANLVQYPSFYPQSSNSVAPIFKVKKQTLAKFLNHIAETRSTLLCQHIYQLFLNNPSIKSLASTCHLHKFKWDSNCESLMDVFDRMGIDFPCFQNNSLSLKDYIDLEGSFVSQVLNSLATNTNQIRKNPLKDIEKKLKSRQSYNVSLYFQEPPKAFEETSVPKRTKSVRWRDSRDVSAVSFLRNRFLNLLCYHLSIKLHNIFFQPFSDCSSKIGNLRLCNETVSMFVGLWLETVAGRGLFELSLVKALRSVAKSIEIDSALSAADENNVIAMTHVSVSILSRSEVFCKAIQPALSISRIIEESTLFPDSASAISDLIELRFTKNLCVDGIIVLSNRICRTCRSYCDWLKESTPQLLKKWNVNDYVSIAFDHFKTIQSGVENFFEFTCALQKQISDRSSIESLSTVLADLESCIDDLSTYSEELLNFLSNSIECKCKLYWSSNFPPAKIWRSGSCSKFLVQPYAEDVVNTMLKPVFTSLFNVPCTDTQKNIGSTVISILFKTLLNYIQNAEIKFSITGAQQLGVDFDFIFQWVSFNEFHLQDDVIHSLLQHEAFNEVRNIIRILQNESPTNRCSPTSSVQGCSQMIISESENSDGVRSQSDIWYRLRAGCLPMTPPLSQ